MQGYSVPLISRLVFKLFCENNRGSWWITRNNQMFINSKRSGMAMKKCNEIKTSGLRNEMKDLMAEEDMRRRHGLHPTIYYKRGWAYRVLWTAWVASCVSRSQIEDLQLITESCLFHLVLFSTSQDLSFPLPLDGESRLRKLTVQSDTTSLFSLLAVQVSNDYDWKNWGLNQLDNVLMCIVVICFQIRHHYSMLCKKYVNF